MKHHATLPALTIIAAAMVPTATAAVSSIDDPFLGDHYETFELIGSPGSVFGEVPIFDGTATITDELANQVIAAINLNSFLTNETIFAWNGNFMGGFPTGWAVIEFSQGATDFGGYFGTADILSGGNISFFDADDNLIETQSLELPLNNWEWHGWHSDEAFTRVVIHGSTNPSAPIVLDDLQVNYIPAPGALALLGFAGCAASRRRR
ncbi:MAG: hypothetical protein ACF8MF_02785 [Phycisphaerales bacterium JB052]